MLTSFLEQFSYNNSNFVQISKVLIISTILCCAYCNLVPVIYTLFYIISTRQAAQLVCLGCKIINITVTVYYINKLRN